MDGFAMHQKLIVDVFQGQPYPPSVLNWRMVLFASRSTKHRFGFHPKLTVEAKCSSKRLYWPPSEVERVVRLEPLTNFVHYSLSFTNNTRELYVLGSPARHKCFSHNPMILLAAFSCLDVPEKPRKARFQRQWHPLSPAFMKFMRAIEFLSFSATLSRKSVHRRRMPKIRFGEPLLTEP